MFRLDQKIAFVTGAGSGIGEHIARLFAQQGAHVILADIRLDAAEQVAGEIRDAGGSARTQQLDVAEESHVKAAIEQAVATEGRLDILVNNAGISHVGNILETSLQDWEQVMSVNARGVFLCAREGVRQMLAQSPAGGVIINMSSVAATIGIDRRLPYCASKGAVLALTRSIAIDFVSCTSPPFAAAYEMTPALPKWEYSLAMLIILPRLRCIIERAAICDRKKHELRLVSITRSHDSASCLSGALTT